MKIKGNIIFNYNNEKNAKLACESLEVDNENYISSKLNENKVEYELKSDNVGTFLRTADDLIASEIVVEQIIKNTQ